MLPTQNQAVDTVDPELESLIANTPSLDYTFEDLLLSNGQTIRQFLADNPDLHKELNSYKSNQIRGGRIAAGFDDLDAPRRLLWGQVILFMWADYYTNIRKYGWKAQNVDEAGSIKRPNQPYGLAYVYNGGRNVEEPFNKREAPDGLCPNAELYGMDCSGFVYRVFKNSGFAIDPSNAAGMASLTFWEKVLKSNTRLKDVNINYVTGVDQVSKTPTTFRSNSTQLLNQSLYKPGDIIFWRRGNNVVHMGIVLQDGKTGYQIFQSNGITQPTSDTKTCGTLPDGKIVSKGQCESNYLCSGRGVHTKPLTFIKDMGTDKTVSIIRLDAQLVGNPGNPRFNLQFTNDANVDLDLYVKDPNNETIYYRNLRAIRSPGQLDVDCKCTGCPQGPNENIFWPLNQQSPKGQYEFWVNYYDYCTTLQSSAYTVRVTNDSRSSSPVVFQATGTLSVRKGDSVHWIYDTATGQVMEKR